MADTPTNAELAAEVVGAVAAVRGAQGTVEQAATLLASHLGDPKAHGAETKVNILAAVPKPVWDGKNLGFKNDDNSLSVPAVDLSGPIGPKGEPGLTPSHQWDGTKLKFQNSDGSWPAAGTELKSDSTAEAQEAATIAAGAAERASSSELSVSANADIATQKASVASTAADTATAKAQESATSATAAATSATAAATSAQNAAKSASDAATSATLTAASVDAVTVQAGKAKTQADRAQTEADRAAAVAILAQEGVTGLVAPGRGLGITTAGSLDVDIASETSIGGVQIATAADVASGVAGEVPRVLAVGSDALDALMPTMLIGSIQTMLCADSYVPNGTVPANGGEYTQEQFREFYDTYLAGGKLITCTYAAFAAQVALTGNCAKFALDTTSQKFKVPLLKNGDSITQAASASELGKSYKAGLPNVTGTTGGVRSDNPAATTGAFSIPTPGNAGQFAGVGSGGVGYLGTMNFNLSAGNAIYRNDVTTVLDEQVRLRHFVVLASAQNSASVFDWSNYMAGLAGKANLDMDNMTRTGTAKVANCGKPSARAISVAVPAYGSNTPAAPASGAFKFGGVASAAGQYIRLSRESYTTDDIQWASAGGQTLICTVAVRKGDAVWINGNVPNNLAMTFIYDEGAD